MTEAEWLLANDPIAMIEYRFPPRSPDSETPDERQLQRYFLECARRQADVLPWIGRELLHAADRIAGNHPVDGRWKSAARAAAEELVHNADFDDALQQAERYYALSDRHRPPDRPAATVSFPAPMWSGLAHLLLYALDAKAPIFAHIPAELHSAELLRELFGNPFRPVGFDPHWRTSTVMELIRTIEHAGDFARMPVLADALEDAGCHAAAVLAHLRSGATHVRGCWVLDGLQSAVDFAATAPLSRLHRCP